MPAAKRQNDDPNNVNDDDLTVKNQKTKVPKPQGDKEDNLSGKEKRLKESRRTERFVLQGKYTCRSMLDIRARQSLLPKDLRRPATLEVWMRIFSIVAEATKVLWHCKGNLPPLINPHLS